MQGLYHNRRNARQSWRWDRDGKVSRLGLYDLRRRYRSNLAIYSATGSSHGRGKCKQNVHVFTRRCYRSYSFLILRPSPGYGFPLCCSWLTLTGSPFTLSPTNGRSRTKPLRICPIVAWKFVGCSVLQPSARLAPRAWHWLALYPFVRLVLGFASGEFPCRSSSPRDEPCRGDFNPSSRAV
jgi:hypothetical protein